MDLTAQFFIRQHKLSASQFSIRTLERTTLAKQQWKDSKNFFPIIETYLCTRTRDYNVRNLA